MTILGGYRPHIPRIDLTNESIVREPLPDEEVLRKCVGGTGLGLYLLLRDAPPQARATDPEAPPGHGHAAGRRDLLAGHHSRRTARRQRTCTGGPGRGDQADQAAHDSPAVPHGHDDGHDDSDGGACHRDRPRDADLRLLEPLHRRSAEPKPGRAAGRPGHHQRGTALA
ncbi:MAG: hypothetical protein IH956_03030 [Chloroflexi bacterium]|nr:hypothetical protein [Chloroflexota bacterium]